MPETQIIVEISTIIIFILTFILAVYLTRNYLVKKRRNLLFWSAGLWLFALGVIIETLFAAGVYNEFLIGAYLFIVALLVNALALGSVELFGNETLRRSYYIFSVITLILLLYTLLATNIGNLLINYVVAVPLSVFLTITSSLVTFPAAALLIVIAAVSFRKTGNKKMLSIIAGVVVVSIAGSLYIAQFPAFLYYSEFIGILLLWFGFFDFNLLKNKVAAKR